MEQLTKNFCVNVRCLRKLSKLKQEELAAQLTNTAPENCVVVGDTPADVLGATAANMPVILIPDKVPANDQTRALSRYVLQALSQVPQVIEALSL